MHCKFDEFRKKLSIKNIETNDKLFNKTIHSFNFLNFTSNEEIIQIINRSKIIIIDTYQIVDKKCILMCCYRQMIIIESSNQIIFRVLFSRNNEDKIFFVPTLNQTKQCKSNFIEEIEAFANKVWLINNDQTILKNWEFLSPCIFAYLIKKNYIESQRDRLIDFIESNRDKLEPKEFDETDFITLRKIGSSDSALVELIYHIESEKIFISKRFFKESQKLFTRESNNYKSINFPFTPKFYGSINSNSLVIEYINGQTLKSMNKKEKLNMKQKLLIIIQILYTFQYLHRKGFIYRDLKPDNFIIDSNKKLVLIDFDRMINKNEDDRSEFTNDFGSLFIDPEISMYGKDPSFQNDVYSIGVIIYYLFMEKLKITGNNLFKYDEFQQKYPEICQISKQCINSNPLARPLISSLIDFFIEYALNLKNQDLMKSIEDDISIMINLIAQIESEISNCHYVLNDINNNQHNSFDPEINYLFSQLLYKVNQNDPNAQYKLGFLYLEGQYVKQDISKAIHYLTLAADQNHQMALNNLGSLYYNGIYINRNINKAIYYLTLAADQNNPYAQFNLCYIYFEGIYIKQDINRSIYYLTLAADQNLPISQLNLGALYFDGKYVKQDINKAIHYFTRASYNNNPNAQYELSCIYFEGKYVNQDINKAIYYLTLAANQNLSNAQSILGYLYLVGQYVNQDINKALYYCTLAANQNEPSAQNNLGHIYSNKKYNLFDINKAINYYLLAVNQNYSFAQHNLGFLYYEGKYIKQDINKAIYYFTLAANQNFLHSFLQLGYIYYEGSYVTRDFNKAVHFFSLAANYNDPNALCYLGLIYSNTKYEFYDINKAIMYYKLASEHNNILALNNLGYIYYEGKLVVRDINKAIHYLSIAAKYNSSDAQMILGIIYLEGKYIHQDINKFYYYIKMAANSNKPMAQYILGHYYLIGFFIPQNINKALYYLSYSANQYNYIANFILGVLYSKGDYMKRNIDKAIYHYKEASSFNCSNAKNNLAMIYAKGIFSEINIGYAIELLKEAVALHDPLSMYNLSHIYFYEEIEDENYYTIIDLLIMSCREFFISGILLSIVMAKKYKNITFEIIRNDIKTHKNTNEDEEHQLTKFVYSFINKFADKNFYDSAYRQFKNIDFMYEYHFSVVITNNFFEEYDEKEDKRKNITTTFMRDLEYLYQLKHSFECIDFYDPEEAF